MMEGRGEKKRRRKGVRQREEEGKRETERWRKGGREKEWGRRWRKREIESREKGGKVGERERQEGKGKERQRERRRKATIFGITRHYLKKKKYIV